MPCSPPSSDNALCELPSLDTLAITTEYSSVHARYIHCFVIIIMLLPLPLPSVIARSSAYKQAVRRSRAPLLARAAGTEARANMRLGGGRRRNHI